MSICKKLSRAGKIVAVSVLSLLTLAGSTTQVFAATNTPSQTAINYVRATTPTAISTPTTSNIKVVLDNKEVKLSEPVLNYQDRIFLPVRAITELLGATVGYDQTYKIASVDLNKTHIELPLNRPKAIIDSSSLELIDPTNSKVVSFVYNSRTYLPTRFLAEHLNISITYANNTVYLSTTTTTTPSTTPSTPTTPVSDNKNHIVSDTVNSFSGVREITWKSPSELKGVKVNLDFWKSLGMSEKSAENMSKVSNENVVLVSAKLSDLPTMVGDTGSKKVYIINDELRVFTNDMNPISSRLIYRDNTDVQFSNSSLKEKGVDSIKYVILTKDNSSYVINITGVGDLTY